MLALHGEVIALTRVAALSCCVAAWGRSTRAWVHHRHTDSEATMKALLVSIAFGICALFGASAFAQAPAGAIAQCKDGTYFTGTSHKGACKGHQGVKEWLDKDTSAASSSTKSSAAP